MTAELFVALLVAHLIGDWLVQTDYQAKNKSTSWFAMLGHITTYHLILIIMLKLIWPSEASELPAFLIFLISGITHTFLDRRWPVVWFLEKTGKSEFAKQTWAVFVVDQAAHISILGLLALWFG